MKVAIAVLMLLWTGCQRTPTETGNPDPAGPAAAGDRAAGTLGEQLQQAVAQRQWAAADRIAAQALIAHPGDADVLTAAAVAAAQQGRRSEAAQLLVEAVGVVDDPLANGRLDHAIAALVDVGKLYDAIELLEKMLQQHPEAAGLRRTLIGFLGEAELSQRIGPHLQRLIRDRQFDLPLLVATTDFHSRHFSSGTIDQLRSRNPADHRPLLGLAKQHWQRRELIAAERVLRQILDHHPDFAPAHAMLGQTLVLQGKWDALPQWLAQAPADSDQQSEYWLTLGDAARHRDAPIEVLAAFGQSVTLDPNSAQAWTRLGEVLRTVQHSEDQSQLAQLAELQIPDSSSVPDLIAAIDRRKQSLLDLRGDLYQFERQESRSQRLATEIAGHLLDLGRHWEAEAWLAVASQLTTDPAPQWQTLRSEAVQRLASDRTWHSRHGHPELQVDWARLPRPIGLGDRSGQPPRPPRRIAAGEPQPIRLIDETSRRQLDFYGRVGSQIAGPRVPIQQTLGCGGGVIDFDRDGNQDLVFAAAGGTPGGRDNDPGGLFRNLGDTYQDVAIAARFADTGFGHGVVVGDINDDGFADLLVLNLGRNQLYRNNGDGTFSDASQQLRDLDRLDWSTSGGIVDVDGDGFNDIVIVNYCDASDPLQDPCFDSQGRPINCYPLQYRAAGDQWLQGDPHGAFHDHSERWVGTTTPGRGLGLVAGRLDGTSQSVYIANDATANHWYRWHRTAGQGTAGQGELRESAVAGGIAVDVQSLDQGSMGIAAADLDNDLDLDLYVTGFAHEHNVLYEQQTPGSWSDVTATAGLVKPTLGTVGFGTQAIDFDHDAVDELIVSNGHIGDLGPGSLPYAQAVQLFRRNLAGRYQPLDMTLWGDYFGDNHIGRALFTTDANADGRLDVVITHLDQPVRLLVNHSPSPHHRVVFDLVDRHGPRDAVGAIIQFDLRLGTQTIRKRLYRLAGSGYLSSNAPQLHCGTGTATDIQNVEVIWPDGHRQSLGALPSDTHHLIERDRPNVFPLATFTDDRSRAD